MARNQYMSPKVRTEQLMYEDIVIEALKFYGQDCYYLPRRWQNKDEIFGDDPVSSFDEAYNVEMYIENTEGFDGEGDLFSRFGIELRDECTFVVSRRRFEKSIGTTEEDISFYRPREGDLIWLELTKSLWEITKVETESPFYQIAQLPVFKMRAQLFENNGEDFDTDLADLNQEMETASNYSIDLTFGTQTGTFLLGEIVEQTVDSDAGKYMRGEVVKVSDDTITLIHIGMSNGEYGMFTLGDTVEGSVSGAVGTISSINEVVDGVGTANKTAQNDDFESEALDFVDFSESNPFGDV